MTKSYLVWKIDGKDFNFIAGEDAWDPKTALGQALGRDPENMEEVRGEGFGGADYAVASLVWDVMKVRFFKETDAAKGYSGGA